MAFTSTDLASVEAAIVAVAIGERTVQVVVGGKQITFQQASLDKLTALRDLIQSDIAQASSGGGFLNKVRFDSPV